MIFQNNHIMIASVSNIGDNLLLLGHLNVKYPQQSKKIK